MGNPDGKQNGAPGMPVNCPGAITGMYMTPEVTAPSMPGTFAPLTAQDTHTHKHNTGHSPLRTHHIRDDNQDIPAMGIME